MNQGIFKTYDIRGVYPRDIDEKGVFKIAQAFARLLQPKKIALGRDVRVSSEALWEAAKNGLIASGVEVVDIGRISTDMLYFAVSHYNLDGGMTITASHNPREYNGIKLVTKNSAPIFEGYMLPEIKSVAMDEDFEEMNVTGGKLSSEDLFFDYAEKVRSFGNLENLKSQKILINANFGLAGQVFKKILEDCPVEFVELNCEPDGTFPKGRPDPLVPENREETKEKIKESGAQIGFAWDADADRCFVYNEKGEDIEGCFMGALLAKIMLEKSTDDNKTVVYDPRIVWTVTETIKNGGGIAIPSKVGHAVIKSKMREVNAFLAVESSGHYYFRDYYFCDNGMIPAIIILSYLNEKNITLSEALAPIMENYFVSGEINFEAENKDEIINKLQEKYSDGKFEEIDGISIEYSSFRFNVRKSNTEPLLRLNIEARSQELLDEKKAELVGLIEEWKKN